VFKPALLRLSVGNDYWMPLSEVRIPLALLVAPTRLFANSEAPVPVPVDPEPMALAAAFNIAVPAELAALPSPPKNAKRPPPP
jgi:hypothetical protein